MSGRAAHVAGVLLVRGDGSVLLQLRDAHAPTDAHRWGIPGGGADAGEDPAATACRELLEETGLTAPSPLRLFWSGLTADGQFKAHVFYAPTTAAPDDIVVGEGQAMAFIAGDDVADLDLAVNAAPVLRTFLRSPEYRSLLTTTSLE